MCCSGVGGIRFAPNRDGQRPALIVGNPTFGAASLARLGERLEAHDAHDAAGCTRRHVDT
jgi:hypothetical protein